MIDLFTFIVFGILFILFITINLRLRNKNLELLLRLNEAIVFAEIAQKKFNKDNAEDQEHLLSFLNETRDTAYRYIEDVHDALIEYRNEIAFDLENPNDLSILRFRSAFDKLQKIYPEDSDRI